MDVRHSLFAEDRCEIEDLLFRFMRSFDDKDWEAMRARQAEAVDRDCSV